MSGAVIKVFVVTKEYASPKAWITWLYTMAQAPAAIHSGYYRLAYSQLSMDESQLDFAVRRSRLLSSRMWSHASHPCVRFVTLGCEKSWRHKRAVNSQKDHGHLICRKCYSGKGWKRRRTVAASRTRGTRLQCFLA